MKIFSACIIGCGQIGTLLDDIDSKLILTHAKGFTTHPRVRLESVVDADAAKAEFSGTRWNCRYYTDVASMFRDCRPDIVSICVPDEIHYDYLVECCTLKPKAVVVEKPLTLDLKSSLNVIDEYKISGISLFVNYTRRFDGYFSDLKEKISQGCFGEIYHVAFRYSNGIQHVGSHAIDLANYLFGECISASVIRGREDHSFRDPTLDAVLCYSKNIYVYLLGCDNRAYSIFEFDMLAEKGRIFFEESNLKIEEFAVAEANLFKGYKGLVKKEDRWPSRLDGAILNLIDNVVKNIEYESSIRCSGEDAVKTQKICQKLIDQYFGKNN